MSADYYSDRVQGGRDRGIEEITRTVWGGIVAMVERGVAYPWFGRDFPLKCEDGEAVCGCDERAFRLALAAEIPDVDWPLDERVLPPTLAALDLLEFIYRHASAPHQRSYHGYFSHHHLTFKVAEGKAEVSEAINRVLARGGMAYELDDDGHIQHMASPAVEEQLAIELPSTGDDKFDGLLQSAIEKFRSRDVRVRREALEPLWDAFERSKTMLRKDKRKGIKALIDEATAGADPREAELLKKEMGQLTEIGNAFRIRHHETTKAELSNELSEQLFARMYAFLYRVHDALCEEE
jgi:hypothetical protein